MTLSESTQRRCLSHGLIAGLIFFAGLALFLSSICPTLYWRDAAEFQVVAFELGVAHPAGSPFYTSLAKLFTFLPLGNIAFKVNLASAFFGALLLALTFLLIIECAQRLFPSLNRTFLLLSSTAAVVLYGVSESLWHNSIVAEVYTLQNCLIVWIGLLLVRSLRTDTKRCLYLAAFLFGLSSGAHIIMILYIPALILFLWLFHRTFLSPVHLAPLIMLVMLGASIYLYLPVRSSVDPHYDWGNPETLTNFVTHVTDRKDQGRHFAFYPERLPGRLKAYAGYYYEDFAVLGILLGLSGLFVFMKKNPRLFFSLALFFFSQWWFFIRYWPWSSAFLATFIFFTLLIALGTCGSIDFCLKSLGMVCHQRRLRVLSSVLILAFTVQIVFLALSHYRKCCRADYWNPHEFYASLFRHMEYGSVLFNTYLYFGTSCLQQVENYRPDVTSLLLSEIISPQVFNYATQKRYPMIKIPDVKGTDLGEAIINNNIREHSIYWEPCIERDHWVKSNLQPEGFLFRVMTTSNPLTPEASTLHKEIVTAFFERYTPAILAYYDSEERNLYSNLLKSTAQVFYERKDFLSAITHFRLAMRLTRESSTLLNAVACAYAGAHKFADAEHYLRRALNLNPSYTTTLENLAQVYFDTARYTDALSLYKEILKAKDVNTRALFGYGQTWEKLGNTAAAIEAYRTILRVAPDCDQAKEALERVAALTGRPEGIMEEAAAPRP
nr:DUF2723 domain-containing protein [Deltaproteobacteria bacterium]